MASTTFVDDATTVYASWLNDVNSATYPVSAAITPTDASGASLAFTNLGSKYMKQGNIITFNINLTFPVTASGASAVITPTGVPATFATANGPFTFACSSDGAVVLVANLAASQSSFALCNASTGVAVTNASLSAKTVKFTGSVFIG